MSTDLDSSGPMDVAVVVALYNGAEWIREALGSVMAQTHPPSEIIVVDDGSTDGSPDIVAEEFPEARLVTNPNNGAYAARNYGAKCAHADRVAFLDQDDLWHEDHLKGIRRALQEFPECVVAHSAVARFGNSDPPDYSVKGFSPHTYDPWEDYPYNGLGETVGGVISRDAFMDVDGWSPDVEGGGIHQIWLKLALVGDIVVTGCRTTAKREHERQLSENLRQDQTESYLEIVVNASEDALRRRRQRGFDTERFVPRLNAQKALLDFLRAVNAEDWSGMQQSLRDFGEYMAGESKAVIRGTWHYFWWYAEPVFEQRGIAQSAIDVIGLTRHWPDSLQQPREFFREWATARVSSFELVRRYPMTFRHWSLLARRAIGKLRSS